MNAPWTLPQKPGSAVFDEGARSLKTLPKGSVQGAHLGARSLNAPLGSAIRERVRGGGGRSPAALVLSILHVLTLGYENTCKGTSKEHLTIKIMSRKLLDCLLS
jgi:hypothetical protein